MPKMVIKTEDAPNPVARYSQGIMIEDTLYVQGVIAIDPETGHLIDGNIVEQSERVFKSILAILGAAGLVMADVFKVSVYLKELTDYPRFNQVYNSYFQKDPPPVRTTVQANLPFGALVEVEVIACKS